MVAANLTFILSFSSLYLPWSYCCFLLSSFAILAVYLFSLMILVKEVSGLEACSLTISVLSSSEFDFSIIYSGYVYIYDIIKINCEKFCRDF